MSDKMRRYMIAFLILVTLSALHFALAAPVAVGEIRAVRSNPVKDLRDRTATWEKWMEPTDPNDKDQSSTNDVHLRDGDSGNDSDHPDGAPDKDEEGIDAEGVKERGWTWPGEWEPDASDNKFPKVESAASSPVRTWRISYNPPKNPPKVESDNNGGGGGRAIQSSQGSAENMSPGPQSERPDLMTFLKDWLKKPGQPPKIFRPRDSGSGFVGPPMWELQGTVDSNAYVSDSPLLLQTTQVTNILTPISMFTSGKTSRAKEH
jgi:hypothetical protein